MRSSRKTKKREKTRCQKVSRGVWRGGFCERNDQGNQGARQLLAQIGARRGAAGERPAAGRQGARAGERSAQEGERSPAGGGRGRTKARGGRRARLQATGGRVAGKGEQLCAQRPIRIRLPSGERGEAPVRGHRVQPRSGTSHSPAASLPLSISLSLYSSDRPLSQSPRKSAFERPRSKKNAPPGSTSPLRDKLVKIEDGVGTPPSPQSPRRPGEPGW